MNKPLEKGDYVLATKYSDGDPQDHWCVGFYDGPTWNDRHVVVDGEGMPFRANGFRRVKRISAERGEWMLAHAKDIDQSMRSVWFWARCPMRPVP